MIKITAMIAVGVISALQADEADKSALFTSEDVFQLEYAASPQVSPDGKTVVYVRRSNDIMTDRTRSNLWTIDVNSGEHRPLLSGKNNFGSPRWSPDGTRLAYVSNSEGKQQIFVRWMDTGQTAMVSNLQHSPSGLVWSPDGKTLAYSASVPVSEKVVKADMPAKPKGAKWAAPVKYISRARYQSDGAGILEPAFRHVFVIPAEGGSARQVTNGNFNHGGRLAWTPDSAAILFSANRGDDWEYEVRESDIWSVDIASGDMTQLTSHPGFEGGPVVSPDGKSIAYMQGSNRKVAYTVSKLSVMDMDGGNVRVMAGDLDRRIGGYQWSGKDMLFDYQDHGKTVLARVDRRGRVSQIADDLGGLVVGRPYVSGQFSVSDGGVIAYTAGRPDRPADLKIVEGRKTRQVTNLNEDVLGHKTLGEVREITYNSSFDGEEIQGWYITPPNYDPSRKYPLILEIHGGPHAAYGPVFSAEMQRMAAEGYIVFYDNHRGSSGYGERFGMLLHGKYSSEEDFADHMSGVDALIEMGLADPDNLYITGGSAGGIASAYAIGLTDRFRAAAVIKPVINWVSKVLTADSYLFQIPSQTPGMPWDHLEHYWKRSPLSLVGNVTTPTLLMTGEADRRTPMSETEQFYQALKLLRVDTVMVRVPDAPHGIAGRPSRLVAKVENILAWFRKYSEQPED